MMITLEENHVMNDSRWCRIKKISVAYHDAIQHCHTWNTKKTYNKETHRRVWISTVLVHIRTVFPLVKISFPEEENNVITNTYAACSVYQSINIFDEILKLIRSQIKYESESFGISWNLQNSILYRFPNVLLWK